MSESRKLIDCMKENEGKPWISLEYFPPRTDAGVTNLYERIERMAEEVATLEAGPGRAWRDLLKLTRRVKLNGEVSSTLVVYLARRVGPVRKEFYAKGVGGEARVVWSSRPSTMISPKVSKPRMSTRITLTTLVPPPPLPPPPSMARPP